MKRLWVMISRKFDLLYWKVSQVEDLASFSGIRVLYRRIRKWIYIFINIQWNFFYDIIFTRIFKTNLVIGINIFAAYTEMIRKF